MLDKLFTFPIIMIDRDFQESDDGEHTIIYGEAEVPYDDFIGVHDKWIPVKESYEKALDGYFEGCLATFATMGTYLVPWPKAKFKKKLKEFIEAQPKQMVFKTYTMDNIHELKDLIAELEAAEREGDHEQDQS